MPAIPETQTPIAAYSEQGGAWRVLTAKRLSLNAYTGALNFSLQALFGLDAVAPQRAPKQPAAQPAILVPVDAL
jgi:hypothetical protein